MEDWAENFFSTISVPCNKYIVMKPFQRKANLHVEGNISNARLIIMSPLRSMV